MIFKLLENIDESLLVRGETGYGSLVGIDPENQKYMVKFLKNSEHDDLILYLDEGILDIVDESDAGNEILESSQYEYPNESLS